MTDAPTPIRLSCAEAAKLLGVSPRTLETWRRERRGPPFFRPRPGKPYYMLSDLLRWMDAARVETFPRLPRASPPISARSGATMPASLNDAETDDDEAD